MGNKISGKNVDVEAKAAISVKARGSRKTTLKPVPKVKQETVIKLSESDVRSKYKFESNELGHGHFGTVRKCQNRITKEYFAVKTIRKSKVQNLEFLRREIDILRNMNHPNIITLVDVYEDSRYLHLVTDLCIGGELFNRIITKTNSAEGRYSEADASNVISEILSAIRYCHEVHNISHRDLKPENILFKDTSENSSLKIIDFGLSRFYDNNQNMSTRVGTPYYIAPEVMSSQYSDKCDIWSIGVILYILLCGYPPFFGKTDTEILIAVTQGKLKFPSPDWDAISVEAVDFIKLLLERDPARRPTAAEAMANIWFTTARKPVTVAPLIITAAMKSNLLAFAGMNRLKKVALNIMAEGLTVLEIEGLTQAFARIDVNGDGYVTLAELRDAMEQEGNEDILEEIEALMEGIDLDNNNQIDYKEFLTATMDINSYIREENIRSVFEAFDTDKSGTITIAELSDVMGGMAHAREVIGDIDVDGDGVISYEEFKKMMLDNGIVSPEISPRICTSRDPKSSRNVFAPGYTDIVSEQPAATPSPVAGPGPGTPPRSAAPSRLSGLSDAFRRVSLRMLQQQQQQGGGGDASSDVDDLSLTSQSTVSHTDTPSLDEIELPTHPAHSEPLVQTLLMNKENRYLPNPEWQKQQIARYTIPVTTTTTTANSRPNPSKLTYSRTPDLDSVSLRMSLGQEQQEAAAILSLVSSESSESLPFVSFSTPQPPSLRASSALDAKDLSSTSPTSSTSFDKNSSTTSSSSSLYSHSETPDLDSVALPVGVLPVGSPMTRSKKLLLASDTSDSLPELPPSPPPPLPQQRLYAAAPFVHSQTPDLNSIDLPSPLPPSLHKAVNHMLTTTNSSEGLPELPEIFTAGSSSAPQSKPQPPHEPLNPTSNAKSNTVKFLSSMSSDSIADFESPQTSQRLISTSPTSSTSFRKNTSTTSSSLYSHSETPDLDSVALPVGVLPVGSPMTRSKKLLLASDTSDSLPELPPSPPPPLPQQRLYASAPFVHSQTPDLNSIDLPSPLPPSLHKAVNHMLATTNSSEGLPELPNPK